MRFATITCHLVDGPRGGQAIGIDSTLPAVIEFTEMTDAGRDNYGAQLYTPVSHFYELDLSDVHERPRYQFLASMSGSVSQSA